MNLLTGTSGFAYREWLGKFYPTGFPQRRMLPFYAERFRTVEINATFYRMPAVRTLEGWAAEVPEDFLFAFKAPGVITHRKRLRSTEMETSMFLEAVSTLGRGLGPILFQLPPDLRLDLPLLTDFLPLLPPLKIAFEFRHSSWFDESVYDLLREHGRAFCISDMDGEPPPPVVRTAGFGYARLRRSNYSDDELREWRREFDRQGWEETFVFFRHEESASGPVLAERMMGMG